MKKMMLAILLLPSLAFAQQKMERYCELVAGIKPFSTKVNIWIDYGEDRKIARSLKVKDEDGKAVKFNSLIDALNYMGSQNWKLLNAFPINTGGENVYHFFFKKEYDSSELGPDTEEKK